MRRLLIYVAGAVVLGILAMVVPLVTFAEFKHEEFAPTYPWLRANIRGLEGYDTLTTPNSDVTGFAVVTASFVIAMIVYLLVRRRIPRPNLPWARIPPY